MASIVTEEVVKPTEVIETQPLENNQETSVESPQTTDTEGMNLILEEEDSKVENISDIDMSDTNEAGNTPVEEGAEKVEGQVAPLESATETPDATSQDDPPQLRTMSTELQTITQSDAPTACANCEKDSLGNIIEIVVDENVVADFNQPTPTCIGDQDLCQFFTYEKNSTTANTWNAVFDLGGKRLVVKNGASIKTIQVPTGANNRYAPGIIIKTTCSVFVEEGALLEVQSLNQPAGNILIKGGDDVIIDGSVLNTVGGTMQAPGQITIVSCCGDIITGPKSRIVVNGVDHGGRNIDILAQSNIELHGLIESNYRSGATSTINVISFNGSVLVDGTNRFPDELEGTRIPRTSGIFVYAKRDPLPGQINIRAKGNITVLGNIILDKQNPNFGAVAVKTASNGSKSGTIDVRSLEGSITARDRAFDNANRYGTKGSITLFAKNDISFSVTDNRNDGATTTEKIVVNSEAHDVRTLGGNNIIRSYNGALRIGERATLSTENKNGIDGKNILTSCKGIVNNGRIHFPDLDTSDDTGTCDPSAPLPNTDTTQKILLAKINSYAQGALQCLLDEHKPPENHAPVITILGDNPLTVIQGSTFTDPGATAQDQEDGDITAHIVISGDVITPTVPETYTIIYNVKDSKDIPAPEVRRTVIVKETTPQPPKPQCSDGKDNDGDTKIDQADPACHTDEDPNNTSSYNPNIDNENSRPSINVLGNDPFFITFGTTFTDPGATAFDQEDGDITAHIVVGGHVITPTTPVGTYTITYNVKDSKDTSAPEKTRIVIISPIHPQCSDDTDNDGDDLIDSMDPGCHTDGDPTNDTSYDPNDTDENLPPTLTLNGENPITLVVGTPFVDPGATAQDQEDGDTTAHIVVSGDVITSSTAPGTYTIAYNVKDSRNASAPEVRRTVIISPTHPQCSDGIDNDTDTKIDTADPACHADNNPENGASYDPNDTDENATPIITIVGNNPYEIRTGDAFSDPGATAFDQEDGDITAHIVVSGDVITSSTAVGTYGIVYNVKDSKNTSAPEVRRVVSILSKDNPPSSGGGGGNSPSNNIVGGGGILQQTSITITNERAVSLSDTSALITWTTNIPGTSMVVYGTSTQALADGSRVNFGYTNTTDKRTALIKDHSIVIDGLISKTPYYFRPISEEWSSKAIGREVTISEAPKECNYLLEYLKYGANNNPVEVRKLQVFLRNFEGFTNLEITGFFDLTTFNAVSQFQQKYFDLVLAPWGHDKPTGYVYITTKKRVNEIYCAREFALTDAQKQEIQTFKAYLASLNISSRPRPTLATPPSTRQENPTSSTSTTPPTQSRTISSNTQNTSTSSTPHTDQSSTTPTMPTSADTEPLPEQIDSPPLNLDETPVGIDQSQNGFRNLLASVFSAPPSSGETLECIIALLVVLALIVLMELIWRKPMHHISDKIFFWIVGVFIAMPVALILHLGCIVLPLAVILILLSVLYALNKKEEAR
ncbi:MAG: hypothetical protein A3C84_00230 [Candidatus Ryanbacteria bacterium RIFCSPHIGHO2_02_FULL_48_12]|nr:MAG: hypothetical protein A3C84_00230 [Candidatus Ryanbacteria bacterium RIFCSPHIGHO2_02_FULL_48_12]